MLDEGIDLVAHAISRPSREVNAGSSFQADTLAPQQYQQTMRRKICREPEQELMLAVLKEAIYCIQRYVSARDKLRTRQYIEAKNWIMEEDSDWPFAFANICEVFALSPQYIRAGLLRREQMTLATLPKARIYQFTAGQARQKASLSNSKLKPLHTENWAPPNGKEL